LPNIPRDFKKFTSKELVKTIEKINKSRKECLSAGQAGILELFSEVADHLKRVSGHKIWQEGNHSEILFSAKFMEQKLDYVHNNPVADEIVDEP
jgi:hypothetical protein